MKNILSRIIYTVCALSLCLQLHAQYSTDNKRAIAKFEMARRNYQLLDYKHAEENLMEALQIEPSFVEAYLLLGQMFTDNKQLEKSIEAYENALKLDPSSYPRLYFFLAENQLSLGRYADASQNYGLFISTGIPAGDLAERCKKNLQNCEFGMNALENPVPFEPVNLGTGVNSEYDEYWPSLSADENMLVFTVLLPLNTNNPQLARYKQEDFYYSTRENGQWTQARDAGAPLNSTNNEGAQTITGDGKTMIFTACNRDDGMGLCDLYIAEDLGDRWSVPVNMGRVINTANSEKQPSVSADGRTLYFISNRAGGYGSYDIYYSLKSDDGLWQEPVNIGDSVNTPGIDQSPFIHPDNKTLYFSSDGWQGLGGYDLFVSRKKSSGQWSTPVNLGYPINTHHHEEGMIVNALGNRAYYSSNRLEGRGRDIFEFELYQEVRPVPVSYMKGTVFDAVKRSKLEASFELIDLNTGGIIMKSASRRPKGDFLICIPADADYALNVSKQGYLFYSDNFSMDRVYGRTEPFLMDIPLNPIRAGQKIILKNVFFDYDSYTLKDQSRIELDMLIDFLKENPSLKVEMSGHTDNTGTRQYNQDLSEQRAGEVVRYLLEHQVDQSRISHRGYGMEQPIESNDTEEGRAANRRTELKVLSE